MSENDITGDVLDTAIKIHRRFGPGMLESIYEQLLEAELARRGHKVERQKSVSFEYDGLLLENAFRVDLLIDDVVVVELKATEQMKPVFAKQVKTYLVAMNLQVGIVINFGMATIKEGFTRVVNGFKDNNSQRLCLSASLRETDSSQESVI